MSSWIRNEIKTSREVIRYLVENCMTLGEIDFNTLLPIPTPLEMEEEKLELVYTSILSYLHTLPEEEINQYKELLEKEDAIIYGTLWGRIQFYKLPDNWESLVSMGRIYLENYKEYQAFTWDEWCGKNWGTKWNAVSSWHDECSFGMKTFACPPSGFLKALSKKFPNEIIICHSVDDCGPSGYFEIKNGEFTSIYEDE